jgi:hypothetical protein
LKVPQAVKDKLMGHVPTTISDRYVHLSMDELRQELEKLPWLMRQEETKAVKN